ncbi:alkaline shock response membrane anchor protein AmaP [Schleiferilactobacillus perolens]|jgi:uncharacterized alkaline shock family protein YloU|uniref:Alkaline shock response membrane anchor protein AmaP n=1 Tax=Schleiferilactobacillus perolens DSM 12744 TaxID=1423792 RepID=A0A0R1N0S6_9LACO|nr:alkaline shock response membrane anchor protein AmaP [Schleiferilactobacillus perolens]KRL13926.1 hypothetical protein FD09_GL001959 [Schleiferilactobacillus perolens DSM 12744]MCI1892576.1 alkaline shock response membrane anchor protein AmaP [Schleiferilactobacillus harbinensis]MCI1913629.1 alkaline shock response membrane anchor protein AmaP [Schleiferilactobacillus harbinensis]MCI2171187.1 alkaline shock response membrane anchor protein AmaP [Schleiferilactobacillus perolens]
MRSGTKLLLTVLGVSALLAPLMLLIVAAPAVDWLMPLRNWMTTRSWIGTVAAILSIWTLLFLLGTIARILFRKSTTNQLTFNTDQGQLHISETAVARTVERAIVSQYPVVNATVAVSLLARGQKARVRVEAFTQQNQDLKQLGADIEQTVRTALQNTLGIPVEKVRVTVASGRPAGARVI